MNILRHPRKKVTVRHGVPAILFAVGEFTFAIPADEVDEIRDLHELTDVQSLTVRTTAAKVKFTMERNNKRYFVVDAGMHFLLPPARPTRLLVMRSRQIGVLVDSIDRMTELTQMLPLPNAFTGSERKWYRGLAVHNGKVVPVVSGEAFLSAAEQVIAKSALGRIARKGAIA